MSLPLFVLLVPCLGLHAMLMPLFSASGECCGPPSPTLLELPWVRHGLPVRDAPAVSLRGSTVFVDNSKSGTTTTIAARGEPSVIPELAAMLRHKAMLYEGMKQQPCPDFYLLEVAADTPVVVVKSLVASAAHAGFVDVDFMTRNWSR